MVSLDREIRISNLKWILIIIVLINAAGCATPAKRECLETDWRRLGYDSGLRGEPENSSTSRIERCRREGVPPDMNRYQKGRRQGLEAYCTPGNGEALGLRGAAYPPACPPDLENAFQSAYRQGLDSKARTLAAQIDRLTGRQKALRRELTDVEEQIGYLLKEISRSGEAQIRMRMGMISEMQMLEADQQSLSLQIDALRMDLEEMHNHLNRVNRQAADL